MEIALIRFTRPDFIVIEASKPLHFMLNRRTPSISLNQRLIVPAGGSCQSFAEFSTKTTAKVDRRFDVSIDVRSETTESTRSTRRIRNLNQCQTVTYHYFQLARRYETTLTVVDVRFDIVLPQPPLVLTAPLRALLVDYRVEPARPNEVLTQKVRPSAGIGGAIGGVGVGGLEFARVSETLGVAGGALASTLVHPVVGAELTAPVREITKAELLSELRLANRERRRFEERLDALLSGLHLEPGRVVAQNEICMATTSLYADAMTGVCAACDTHVAETQRLEREKLALEVEKLRRELGEDGGEQLEPK